MVRYAKSGACISCNRARAKLRTPTPRKVTTGPCKKCNLTERDARGGCVPCRKANALARAGTGHGKWLQRVAHLRKRYGITPDQADALLQSQGGVCAICKSDSPRGHRNWHIDHDHETGVARGVLCGTCNQGLGQFRDNATLLIAAADYLTNETQPTRAWFMRESEWLLANCKAVG